MNQDLIDDAKNIVTSPMFRHFKVLYPHPAKIIHMVSNAQDPKGLGNFELCRDLWHAFFAGTLQKPTKSSLIYSLKQFRNCGITPELIKETQNTLNITIVKSLTNFLQSLQCPNCTGKPHKIDWLLEKYSNGQPQFICLKCKATYPITGLKFKQQKP